MHFKRHTSEPEGAQIRLALDGMRPFALALVSSLLLIGCGGGGGGSRIFSEQQYVTAAGGTTQFRGGRITLVLPVNAVTENTRVRVQAPPSVTVPVDANVIPDTTFQFDAITFASNATVSFSYDPSLIPAGVAETRLRVVRLVSGAWTTVTSTQDVTNDRLTITTNTLSVYAIRYQ